MDSTADNVEAKDSVEAPMPDAGSHNGSAVDKQEAPCIGLCVTHNPASTLYPLSTFVFGYVCIAVIVIGRSFIINLL